VLTFIFYNTVLSSNSSNFENKSTPTLLISSEISRSFIYSYILSKKYGSSELSKLATTTRV